MKSPFGLTTKRTLNIKGIAVCDLNKLVVFTAYNSATSSESSPPSSDVETSQSSPGSGQHWGNFPNCIRQHIVRNHHTRLQIVHLPSQNNSNALSNTCAYIILPIFLET